MNIILYCAINCGNVGKKELNVHYIYYINVDLCSRDKFDNQDFHVL